MIINYKVFFVIPDVDSFVSGGNLYNCHLVKALKAKGQKVRIIDFESFESIYNDESDDTFFIDSLYMDKLSKDTKLLKNCFLIVHHLDSLYPSNGCGLQMSKDIEHKVLERFDGFLTSSHFTSSYLSQMGFGHKKCLAIPPSLCFEPLPKKKDASMINALLVNNLVERKGVLPFLKALQNREINLEKCLIRIVGSADLEPAYGQACFDFVQSDEKLSSFIKFEGGCDQVEIQKLYQSSNLFISASFMETYGMALQEALSHNIWLLARDAGNVSNHIYEGKNGSLFKSAEGIATHLEYLLENNDEFVSLVERAWTYKHPNPQGWAIAADDFSNYFLRSLVI